MSKWSFSLLTQPPCLIYLTHYLPPHVCALCQLPYLQVVDMEELLFRPNFQSVVVPPLRVPCAGRSSSAHSLPGASWQPFIGRRLLWAGPRDRWCKRICLSFVTVAGRTRRGWTSWQVGRAAGAAGPAASSRRRLGLWRDALSCRSKRIGWPLQLSLDLAARGPESFNRIARNPPMKSRFKT